MLGVVYGDPGREREREQIMKLIIRGRADDLSRGGLGGWLLALAGAWILGWQLGFWLAG